MINLETIEDFAIQSKTSIRSSYTNKRGNHVVVCENERSKDILLPKVKAVFNKQKVVTPPSKLPTIMIHGIRGKYTDKELFTAIQNQNMDRGIQVTEDNLKIIFTRELPTRDITKLQAVVRVSDEIRGRIQAQNNRLCIGLCSCEVTDHFYVRRCVKCQLFHHKVADCKSDDPVCGKCGEKHETNTCHTFKSECSNCKIAGMAKTNHPAYSKNCPSYIKEQNKLRDSIPYYDVKNR